MDPKDRAEIAFMLKTLTHLKSINTENAELKAAITTLEKHLATKLTNLCKEPSHGH